MQRFWSKVRKRRGNLCWDWQAAQRNGYGQFRYDGEAVSAHRVAWELTNGPIPNGAHVLHICDNRLCVRPSHLYLGDDAQNGRDRAERKRARGNRFTPEQPDHYNKRKTHCPKGHPYSKEVVGENGNRHRQCNPCMAEATRRWRDRNPEYKEVKNTRRRTPEQRAKARAYRTANLDRVRAYAREWARKNKATASA